MSYRLVGFPPFWHRKQLVMLRNIMEGKYEFVSPEWDDISNSAKDLVCLALFLVHAYSDIVCVCACVCIYMGVVVY